ncbi:MAG: hypothetical protein LBS74_09115, partial [Oscillospiraceae bacterium]|nr:hypothetical protein [Oscillospiraceae bacterium]
LLSSEFSATTRPNIEVFTKTEHRRTLYVRVLISTCWQNLAGMGLVECRKNRKVFNIIVEFLLPSGNPCFFY